jgi:hypothetical protein
MSSILLRKLTKKSTLKFGKFKDYTVGHLFGMKKQIELTSIYFKLSTITFTDDILDELGITEEYRIAKPSKNVELYKEFMMKKYGKKQKPNKKLQAMSRETVSYRKDFLMSANHGVC